MKIYCGIDGNFGSDVVVVALAENGDYLATHVSSSTEWAKEDIGYNPDPRGPGRTKRARYAELYPDGFETIWIEDTKTDARWLAAYELNQKQSEQAADKATTELTG